MAVSCGGGSKGKSDTRGGVGSKAKSAETNKRVYMWVLSGGRNGNLGGVSGADALCGNAAPTNLTSLTHRALIGARGHDPRTLVDGNRPVYRADKTTLIVDKYKNFFDPAITLKNSVTGNSSDVYWTGIYGDGGIINYEKCAGWTNATSAYSGFVGHGGAVNVGRFHLHGTVDCHHSRLLLCLSH